MKEARTKLRAFFMKQNSPNIRQHRNVGILAHVDAGKTTLTERILFYCNSIDILGEVHEGTAVTDWMLQEQERGITITAASIQVRWRDHTVNVIDTPGHIDFSVEVERSLRVLDGAVAVVSAVEGVEAQTEMVWGQASKYAVPTVIFVNKLDREGADFFRVFDEIESRLSAGAVMVQLPLIIDEKYEGFIDLVSMKAYQFKGDKSTLSQTEVEIPSGMADEAEVAREFLLDAVLVGSEPLVEKYLRGETLPLDELRCAIARAVVSGGVVPVLCGSALLGYGVMEVLDAVTNYLPSPIDGAGVFGVNAAGEKRAVQCDPSGNTTALVFKKLVDNHVGPITYFRVYSGTVYQDTQLENSRSGEIYNVSKMVRMFANEASAITAVTAGDIGCFLGNNGLLTGDTVCSLGHVLALETISFSQPVAFVAIEAEFEEDVARLNHAILSLVAEDPTLEVGVDELSGLSVIRGMGELQLEVAAERVRTDFGVKCRVGRPKVSYLETVVGGPSEGGADFQTEIGGRGAGAHVELYVEPASFGVELSVVSRLPDEQVESLTREQIDFVKNGVLDSLQRSGQTPFQFGGVRVVITSIYFHSVDANDVAFFNAGGLALARAIRKMRSILLEPTMRVEIVTPDDYMGPVVGEVNSRRGKITRLLAKSGRQVIEVEVPLSSMFGFASTLRSLTQGRASHTMQFLEYKQLPANIAAEFLPRK